MRPSRIIAIATLLTAAAYSTSAYAIKTDSIHRELRIQFEDSKNFTDIDTQFGSPDRSGATVLKTVRSAFQKSADKYLPSGYALVINVTNIEMAGDRSMLTSQFGDYRVYTDMYPPRIDFTYAIYDSAEQLVASGTAKERDLGYNDRLRSTLSPYREKAPYVAELVRGWASKELRRAVTE